MSMIRNILYTCVSASVIMTGTVFNTLADENSKSLHFEITGGLGTAEVVTDNGISYSVEGGDDLFHFIPDTELKITIHSKYGIDSIKEPLITGIVIFATSFLITLLFVLLLLFY